MDENARKEMFSYAYVQAVASVAGFAVENKSRPMDNAGVDLTIESPGRTGEILDPKFDAQVKCTSSEKIIHQDCIKYPLPVQNYNRLRSIKTLVPQVLIVVLVPKNISEWLNVSEQEMLIKKCGYWVSLKGSPETQNNSTITVSIPRKNLFTPENLSFMMKRIDRGDEL